MKNESILNCIKEILNGNINLDDGAFRAGISRSEMQKAIKTYSIQGETAFSTSIARKFEDYFFNKINELKISFKSYPAFRQMKMKMAYTLASFMIVSVGIIMFTFSTSIFPGMMHAAEQNNFHKMRLVSNMSLKNSKLVDKQLNKAGSIYERMAKILAKSKSKTSKKMLKMVAERTNNLNKIRTSYIKHGRNMKKNVSLKYKEGEIYERMLEALPEKEIKNKTKLSKMILKRVQQSEQKLSSVKKYYKKSLRKPVNHYKNVISKMDKKEIEPVKTVKKEEIKKIAVKQEDNKKRISKNWLKKLHKKMQNRKQKKTYNSAKYESYTKMPVISKFNRHNQIVRKLKSQNTMLMPPYLCM